MRRHHLGKPRTLVISKGSIMRVASHEGGLQFPPRLVVGRDTQEQRRHEALTAELGVAHARIEALQQEMRDLSQHQVVMAQEFEHRLINGLQLIASLLSLQSRVATTPEAAAQLTVAARRVAALGRVHRRLHLLDHQDKVEFKEYLTHLCDDLSSQLAQDGTGSTIVVEAAECEIPTASAIPLGFVVNELITNSMKYGRGNITVRCETTSPARHSLSVLDEGPGLPTGFDHANSQGLGMKIVHSLVKQIGGELHIASGDDGRGARFTVTFCSSSLG
jgi:two-component sensor histidine kinase